MPLSLNDRFRPRTPRAFVAKVVDATLGFTDRPAFDVSLLLTDNAEIAQIHGEFLDDPTPTDVISFPMDDGVEIVVSVERAREIAAREGHTIRAEIALYIVHGILHACGFDDITDEDRARMRVAERAILMSIGQRVTPVDE